MRNNTKKDFRNEFRKSLIPSSISLLAFSGLLHRFLGVFAQIKNTDVAETHTCTMTAEANIAILVEKSGVVFVVHGISIVFSSVGSYVVSLASLANVAIGNNFSVHGNGNTVANGTNFLGVPSVLLKGDVLWHADSVNRAGCKPA